MYKRGSEWRKWDLHAHTPIDSEWIDRPKLDTEEDKEEFAKKYIDFAREQGLSVIAITDHNLYNTEEDCLIPYIKKEAKNHDITIFPGVEITIKEGSGIHILIIFDEKSKVSKINSIISQFFKPSDLDNKASSVIESNKNLDDIKSILDEGGLDYIIIFAHVDSNKGVLSEKSISGNFRSELWKKEYVKIAQFTKDKQNLSQFYRNILACPNDINYRRDMATIIASDCRKISKDINNQTGDKTRLSLGEKFTWIKGNPTLHTLNQIPFENDNRIFIGDKPQIIIETTNSPRRFISKLNINNDSSYADTSREWFKDKEIFLNPELVAIIGNKGSGKSAIAEIIALLGNTHLSHTNFSFLTSNKFRSPKDRLDSKFYGELHWLDGSTSEKIFLDNNPNINGVEKVKYIPQSYFEKICNIQDTNEFAKELNSVIFSHIPISDRLGELNLEDLLKKKEKALIEKIKTIKDIISKLNDRIISLEKKQNTNEIERLKNLLKEKVDLLKSLPIPQEVVKPNISEQVENDLMFIKAQETSCLIDKGNIETEISLLKINQNHLESIKTNIENFENEYTQFKNNLKEIIQENSLELDTGLIKFDSTDFMKSTKEQISKTEREIGEKNKKIAELDFKINSFKTEFSETFSKLDEESKKYQSYIQEFSLYEQRKKEIEGDENSADTIVFLEKEIEYIITQLPEDLSKLYHLRIENAKKIYAVKKEIIKVYNLIKEPIDDFVKENSKEITEFKISLDTDIKMTDFVENFFSFIHGKRKGKLKEYKDNQKKFIDKFDSNFNEENNISSFLSFIANEFNNDDFDKNSGIFSQLLDGKEKEFYSFIYELDYLQPKFSLKLDGKTVEQLSPGERGALLLVFYLSLDKNNIPLILDQPEDNLDNQSISSILVPFIKKAKKKRQIIMVTHNPNLAVVADAEQIIYIRLDKQNNYKMEIITGAIEDPKINEKLVEVLEGTLPAFTKRDIKYAVTKANSK